LFRYARAALPDYVRAHELELKNLLGDRSAAEEIPRSAAGTTRGAESMPRDAGMEVARAN
jgi:hypothetical protein